MITLFIDTSTTTLNVGLIKDDLLIDKSSMSSSEHSKYTMSEIEKLFKNSNISPKSVDKIMVIDGPGSFTGVRIGVTIAKTYAWACKINVVPISTLKAYALSLDGYDYYVPLIDARRGYVYGAVYDKNYDASVKDTYVELDKLKSVADNLENVVFISNDKFNLETVPAKIDIQKIYNYYKDEEGVNPHALVPSYLKKTEAEEKIGDIHD